MLDKRDYAPFAASRLPDAPEALSPERELAARCGMTAQTWQGLERRARELGGNPFDLAIGEGTLDEAMFARTLAEVLGVAFLAVPPAPADGMRAEEAIALRSYPTQRREGTVQRAVAPNGALAGILLRQHAAGRLAGIALTTRQALLDAIVSADSRRIARRASHLLPERFSAGPTRSPAIAWTALGVGLAVLIGLVTMFPVASLVLPPLLLAPIFLIAAIAALTATIQSAEPVVAVPPIAPARLPRYTLLIPLYKEANIVDTLIARIAALEYPRDRIEAIFLAEADDTETLAALKNARMAAWMMVMAVPAGEPRTKPRALNAALPFSSGDLLVVYDAEDAPEPDQLLRAAALFAGVPPDVGCLQARLAIANVHDSSLTRRFAIEYASLFDCIKAGMGRATWPVPLGGSSNHFRVSVLRQVGGWDAWNVTEDADLGLRLALFGWRVDDLRSTTWEEAPITLAAWMNQRTRWMKGWLQTAAVHLRHPRLFGQRLGAFRTMIIASTGLAVLLGSILQPFFFLAIILRLSDATPLGHGPLLHVLGDVVLVTAVAVGTIVEVTLTVVALKRRKALNLLPYLLLAPVIQTLVSFAVWRAIVDLVRRPYHWRKTMHGRARHSGGLAPIGD